MLINFFKKSEKFYILHNTKNLFFTYFIIQLCLMKRFFYKKIFNIFLNRSRFTLIIWPIMFIPLTFLFVSIISGITEKKIKNYNDANKKNSANNDDNDIANNEKIEVIRKAISNDSINKDNNLEELNKTNSEQDENKIKYDIKNEKINNNNKDNLIQIKTIADSDGDEEHEKNNNKQEIQAENRLEKIYARIVNPDNNIRDGKKDEIIITDEDGKKIYEGKHKNGKPDGYGKIFDKNTLLYEGNFHEGLVQGQGFLYDNGCKIFEGEFVNNKKSGVGTEYYYNGQKKFTGNYTNNVRNGKGAEYYEQSNKQVKTEATWKNGNIDFTEKIKRFYEDGTISSDGYEEYIDKNGKYDKNMVCITYYNDGKEEFKGIMKDRKPWIGEYRNENNECFDVKYGRFTQKREKEIKKINIKKNLSSISEESLSKNNGDD